MYNPANDPRITDAVHEDRSVLATTATERDAARAQERAYAADLKRVMAERDEARRALESLTPGGSEFHNDPARCVAWVQERREADRQMIIRFKIERDELRERLTEAERELDF